MRQLVRSGIQGKDQSSISEEQQLKVKVPVEAVESPGPANESELLEAALMNTRNTISQTGNHGDQRTRCQDPLHSGLDPGQCTAVTWSGKSLGTLRKSVVVEKGCKKAKEKRKEKQGRGECRRRGAPVESAPDELAFSRRKS